MSFWPTAITAPRRAVIAPIVATTLNAWSGAEGSVRSAAISG